MKYLGLNDVKSTYQRDYCEHNFRKSQHPERIFNDPEENVPPIKSPKYVDPSTLYPFKEEFYVPFNLMFQPKKCVSINPLKQMPEIKLEEKIFEEKLKMRKIRPRVHMIPQICLDDVPEDTMYGENGLAENIYTSDWKRSSKLTRKMMESKNNFHTIKNKIRESEHFIDIEKGMESTRIKQSYPCTAIDAGYLKYVKNWDNYQPKANVDKTTGFWKRNKDKGLCSICEDLKADINLSIAEKIELQSALRNDQIRVPYVLLPPGYGGYTPQLPIGIPLRKTLFKRCEPFITSSMEIQGEFLKQKNAGKDKN